MQQDSSRWDDDGERSSPAPRRATKTQVLAFRQHLPNTYIHTVSIEAVLAPIAEQLSNLIVIVAKAERAGKGIRNLSKCVSPPPFVNSEVIVKTPFFAPT
jgi:hypothetical protein